MTGKRPQEATRRGRKPTYEDKVKARFDEIAKWCELGATDKEIIELLGIATSTFYDYKNRHPEFSELLKRSRRKPVMEIKAALYRRALGFSYDERTRTEDNDGHTKTTTVTKTALPDPASAMILLKHWAKDEGWTNDPQLLRLKREELELRKRSVEADLW